MDQHQIREKFRVSFPLRYKLVLTIVLLLAVGVGTLAYRIADIVREDKRTYLQSSVQSTSRLAATAFSNASDGAVTALRQILGDVDPRKPITPQIQADLRAKIENTNLLGLRVGLLDLTTNAFEPKISAVHRKGVEEGKLFPVDRWVLKPEAIGTFSKQLKKSNFAFFNATDSEIGDGEMRLGVMVYDKGTAAAGVVGIEELGRFMNKGVTIATDGGYILYDWNSERVIGHENLSGDPFFDRVAEKMKEGKLTSAQLAFNENGQEAIGGYEVLPGGSVVALSRVSVIEAYRSADQIFNKFVILAAMVIGAAVVVTILFSHTLTAPINQLYEATKEVALGHFEIKVDTKSHDEIGALSDSFSAMSKKISELIKESVEKTRLESELAVASTVQQTLIPPPSFLNERVLIRSHYQSASECGGDCWNFFWIGNRLVIFIADATGHGIPSALITAAARSCFSTLNKLFQDSPGLIPSPGVMLSFANRAIHESASGKIMMTFFLAVMDFDSGKIRYSSAGHNPPWLFRSKEGKFELKSLTAKGNRLGEEHEVPPYEEEETDFAPGDILLLYTDGLIEGKNPGGDQYGKKKMRKMVEANLGGGPEGVVTKLIQDFLAHNGDKALDDDVTLAVTRVLPRT